MLEIISRRTWVAVLVLVAVLGLAGCASAGAGGTASPSPTAGATATRATAPSVAATASPQASADRSESGAAPAISGSPTRRNEGGSVTIDVTWKNPGETAGPIAFKVAMDTHSVDLDKVDLGKVALLRNDQGQEAKPQAWDAPLGGHHREGTLLFPSQDGSGSPMVGAGVRALELVIRDVAGVKERVLRWEVAG